MAARHQFRAACIGCLEIDELSVERKKGGGELALGCGHEIHELSIALRVKVGTAWRLD
jgi:hypothetical protein